MDRKKIRIIRILNRFNLGGPTLNASLLSRYLPEPFETLLIGGTEEKHEASSLFIPRSMELEPVQIPSMSRKINLLNDFRSFIHLIRIIRRYRPHIIHTHAAKAGFLGRFAAWICRVPVIVHTYHGHVFKNYFSPAQTRLIILTEKILAKISHAIICISPTQKKEICGDFKICPEHKCHIIRLGFDLQKFHPDLQHENRTRFRKTYLLKDDMPAIGIIGRLAPVKNHLLFIRSLRELKKKNIPFRAFIVGDGETRSEAETACSQLDLNYVSGIPPHAAYDVCFTGWIKDMTFVLAGLDMVCLSSLNEGTPVSLIEAQAAGKIIVSTPVGGIPDILFSPYFFLTEKTDFSDFPDKLQQAIEYLNSSSTKKTTETAEKIIHAYHYKRLVSEMQELYLSLLREKKLI